MKTFEPAFRGANQIYKDLGNALIEKNKSMFFVALIINLILGLSLGSCIFFFNESGGPIVISVIVLATYIITFVMLIMTGEKLKSYLWGEETFHEKPMTRFLYIDANGQRQGPIDGEQFRELMAQGVIVPTTLVKAETGWQGPAGEIPINLLP